ncbi:MAG: leucine-rich repeat domain-containing protein, partial [Porphyromonas endodontalis]
MMKKLLVLMAWVVCSVASLWHANAQEENFDAVVNLSEAGKLYDEAPDNIWEETAVSVKIIGKLNSYDLRVLRQFCGSDEYGTKRPHASVRRIDLSEATIVPGGGTYYIRVEDLGNMREYVVDETKPDMLPEKLFYGCSTIESLTLPKNIRSIGIGAFFKCENLKEVIIPDEVTHIYATVFGACPVLEEIKLPSKLEFLGNYAFTHCRALKEITIPEGVKEIRHNSFDQTDALKVINLPKEMETFDESA